MGLDKINEVEKLLVWKRLQAKQRIRETKGGEFYKGYSKAMKDALEIIEQVKEQKDGK